MKEIYGNMGNDRGKNIWKVGTSGKFVENEFGFDEQFKFSLDEHGHLNALTSIEQGKDGDP